MSRISWGVAFLVALSIPDLAVAQGRRNGDSPARSVYQEYDRATDATFTATVDATGNALLAIKGGDFALQKVVGPTGDATLQLTQGKDVVTIAISQAGFQVGRGRRTLRWDPRTDKDEGFDAVRTLLLGSPAVSSFKRLSASLEQRDENEDDLPLAVAALIDGAIVQLLDGDVDAPKRIARRVTRKQRAALRVVSLKRAPDQFRDCIGLYQVALMDAYSQYAECWLDANDSTWWTRSLIFKLCEWEWAIRSQQYIWQFIGCFMFPF